MERAVRVKKTCHCGGPLLSRYGCSPTGKKDIHVLVRPCRDCGQMFPVFPERLGYAERAWLRRWNVRALDFYERELK